jgi:hypothetical protein
MIISLMLFFGVLFSLKIAYNITIPFALAQRTLKASKNEKVGISLGLIIEVPILILLTILSFFTEGLQWFNQPSKIALYGTLTIIGSYALALIFGVALGWLISLTKRGP